MLVQILISAALAALPAPASAASALADARVVQVAQGGEAGQAPPRTAPRPVYQPPRLGKPALRSKIASATRVALEAPRPHTLAPEHVARTREGRPRLYWSIEDAPGEAAVVFTLIAADGIDPLCEHLIEGVGRAGAYAFDLADCGVELAPGVEYEWAISVMPDRERHSRDKVEMGWIQRVEPPEELGDDADARALGGAGLWYDALDRAVRTRDAASWKELMRQIGQEELAMP